MENQNSETSTKSFNKYLILASVAAFSVALDQAIKIYVHSQFLLGESISVIPQFFNITYVRNPGAAFGFLAETPPAFRENFFLAMPPIALLLILGILRKVPNHDRVQILALSSVFGGAIGNYIDRIRFKYVIDFIDFHYKDIFSYPAFNIADMAIVMGVAVLILQVLFEKKQSSAG